MGTTRATHYCGMDIAAKNYMGKTDSQPDIDACIASGANTPVRDIDFVKREHSNFYRRYRLRLLTCNHVTEMQRHRLQPGRKELLLLPKCVDD